jgi:methyl-accepting chemotaxis protein
LEASSTLINGFGNIVRSLNLLCVSTKIEDARFSHIDTGFGSLSDDIRRLAVSIEEKATSTEEGSKSLKLTISHALQRISEIESKRHSQAELILCRTGSNLASMRGKYELSTVLAEEVSAKYGDISRSIGEIVTSMQFHDITRQRFEHIQEALGSLIPSLKGSDTDTVSDICKLQVLQIEQTRDLFIQAVHNIIENLQNTARTICEVSEESLRITGAADQVSDTFLSNMEGELTGIASILSEYNLITQELSRATNSAIDKTAGMSAFIKEIEKIGLEIKLIALNAVIKAAHIGEEGKALSTLAEAIHHLSSDANLLTAEVARAFTFMSATACELSTGFSMEHDRQADKDGSVADEMKDLVGLLNRLNSEIASRAVLVRQSGAALIADIEETVQKITMHEEVSGAVEEIIPGLHALADLAGTHSTAGNRESGNKLLESLESAYTMESERLAHQRLREPKEFASAGAPALMGAMALTNSSDDKGNKEDEEDLGENVELF